ncbi:aryl-alcohol dehydrogenase-like predicted oxidoreductase [Roseiarcus fermentans]|uniref:Aryl-alcohol dehydrogenase-like predicted oxidoreductase n=1 Tax=Roseiarcus fermentans TaxID=1473586 RepID=A0A366FSU9_9HYPH|nr:aldo/keto reductase [Roseiarcus fermentans]RBP17698.1 aryl-alcohol dehydrogenase-like predicted oxidoreductase [Roseiarcus fermentans]
MLAKRKLGGQGLEVSAIGLGCLGMTQAYYGPADDAESIATIHRAIDLGCTFFDTAESYGPFANEALIGRALKGRRERVTIATKFGFKFNYGSEGGVAFDSRPKSIRAAVEGSLRRLATDRIDLLFQHRVDPAVPIEDVAGTVGDLVREGKVLYFGLSEAGVGVLRRALREHPVSALQSEYSLWERNLEADVLPALRELGVGLVAFSPLGRGFLTGEAKRAEDYPEGDYRRNDPRYQGSAFDANVKATAIVQAIAAAAGVKPAQIALAWALHKSADIVPIPGAKRRRHLEENVAAAAVALDAAQIAALDEALGPGRIAGQRYPDVAMAAIDR